MLLSTSRFTKIAELATLKDSTITEMQFRSFLVSASYS